MLFVPATHELCNHFEESKVREPYQAGYTTIPKELLQSVVKEQLLVLVKKWWQKPGPIPLLEFCNPFPYLAPQGATIQLLESPIPTTPATTTTSQKASSGDISGTKRGIIDPLVSKRPIKILNQKI